MIFAKRGSIWRIFCGKGYIFNKLHTIHQNILECNGLQWIKRPFSSLVNNIFVRLADASLFSLLEIAGQL